MAKENDLKKELKDLGMELGNAFREMKNSKEFKGLEKDVISSFKTISTSLGAAVKAAQKSKEAKKLKSKLGRVIEIGTAEGKVEAKKAQAAAVVGIRKVKIAIKDLKKRFEKNNAKKNKEEN